MKKKFLMLPVFVGLLALCACAHTPELVARYTPADPGAELGSEAWKRAESYPFQPSSAGPWYEEIEQASGMKGHVLEPGSVRLLWNRNFLYVCITMKDSDLADQSLSDQTHIFTQADAVELFLREENHPCYWEIYGSAAGRKTCYFFAGRGLLGLPGNNVYEHRIEVRAVCDGTLNKGTDRDRSWTLFFKIPAENLTRHGPDWKPGAPWRILFVRHNYSVHLPSREVSVCPAFNAKNPHLYEEYGKLILAPPEE